MIIRSLTFLYIVVEPNDSWTIEQVLQWWLLRSQSETEAVYEQTVSQLTEKLNTAKESLWQDHEQVLATLQQQEQQSQSENQNPQNQQLQQKQQQYDQPLTKQSSFRQSDKQTNNTTATTSSSSTTSKNTDSNNNKNSEACDALRVDILHGEYEGSTFFLNPAPRMYAWVGRSQGKKFREKGISLPKDLEVSTTHGKFELRRGKYIYMDEGSTNGSLINGEKIEPKVVVELETGTEITVGQTIMQITLPDDN